MSNKVVAAERAGPAHLPLNTVVGRLVQKQDWPAVVKLLSEVRETFADQATKDAVTMDIASMYGRQWMWEEAGAHYADILAHNPNNQDAIYGISICQLHMGQVVAGFSNYGFRWSQPEMLPHYQSMCNKGVPYLDAWHKIDGKRLFVSSEQGLGDEIMFSRVLVEAAKLASVEKLTPPALMDFLGGNIPRVKHHDAKLSTLPAGYIAAHADYIVSVGDLFRLYVMHFHSLPPAVQYRAADPVSFPKGVGFASSAGTMGDTWMHRNVPIGVFKGLSQKFDLYHLNPGANAPEWSKPLPFGIKNFADTADIVAGLDAVVSVDTSVIHLAASLGKKTVLVFDKYLDWRFKIGLWPDVKLLSLNSGNFRNDLIQHMLDDME